jgi:hypothetical protein
LSEATYVSYPGNTIVRLGISEESQNFTFPSGSSRFAGLKFISEGTYGVLEATTSVEGIFLPAAKIYIPTFMFLDLSFRELTTVEPIFFQNTGKHEDSRWSTFYGACFVPPRSKYVLVFSDPSKQTGARVRHLNGGGFGADLELDRVRKIFKQIDKRLFASGRVRPFNPQGGYAIHDLRRQAVGELKVSLTPVSELTASA